MSNEKQQTEPRAEAEHRKVLALETIAEELHRVRMALEAGLTPAQQTHLAERIFYGQ